MTDDIVIAPPQARAGYNIETVTHVHHWTDELFTFRTTRDPAFRFQSGQFVMIGIEVDGKPLVRAYSIVSPAWADELEFYSIKVQDGPLTSRLQHLRVNDRLLVGRKATGTLVLDGLTPGRRLYLLGTGTGLAPFLALVRDPEVYERFETVVVTHTCRQVADLSYRDLLEFELGQDELIGEQARAKFRYYPTVTREPFKTEGRITDLMASGKMTRDLGLPALDPAQDRLMLCGGPSVLASLKQVLTDMGFKEGSLAQPGDYVLERAFVEQ